MSPEPTSNAPESGLPSSRPSSPPSSRGGDTEYAVQLTNITKKFGPKVAVDSVSIRVKAGQVYGLIGPNGAGKTTTFSMLSGFLKPTSGEIDVLGFAPSNVDALRSRIGILPQDAILPPTEKVGEFMVHMARLQDIPDEKVDSLCMAALKEVDGADWWKTRCAALSHGMAKRVQLAQALLGDPEVIMLDEPTAGLDPRVAYEVRQIIKRRRGRATMIISSHNLQELEEVCDGAVILDQGRVVAAGSINQLTGSSEEIHIRIARPRRDPQGGVVRSAAASVPLAELRAIPNVRLVEFDDSKNDLVIRFDRAGGVEAEDIIGHCLSVLLHAGARVSGVTKGKGLEQRVMELT